MRRSFLFSSAIAAATAIRPSVGGPAARLAVASLSRAASVRASVTPPVAKRVPHTVKFGVVPGENRGANPMVEALTVQDDYFWIRDDTRKDEEVLQILREENAYSQACTAHLGDFRGKLYDEMLSHVQEDDDTYPSPAADGYEYWSRTVKGQSFRQYLRRPIDHASAEPVVILDVNAVPTLPFFTGISGWDSAQCDVHDVKPSPSGALLAYSVDGSGYETYNIRLRDLASGSERDEQIKDTGGTIAWADENTFFYTTLDGQHRPHQVWRHVLGTSQADDELVYEDPSALGSCSAGLDTLLGHLCVSTV